jgi:hypothetical protein
VTFVFEIDPVCHMQVLPETAAGKYDYKGKTYYFCETLLSQIVALVGQEQRSRAPTASLSTR